MTNSNYTHLAMVVDRSGSMQSIVSDMNPAILNLLKEQAEGPGELLVDITTFDTTIEHPYTGVDALDVQGDIIRPRGGTALNDAVGFTIRELGERFAKMSEEDRPGTVIVVIVTDGMENSSREYKTEQIKAMVTEQTEKWGWNFIYLAANVDAFATGAQMGYGAGSTIAFAASSAGTQNVYDATSANITRMRAGDKSGYVESERVAAMMEDE